MSAEWVPSPGPADVQPTARQRQALAEAASGLGLGNGVSIANALLTIAEELQALRQVLESFSLTVTTGKGGSS
jgi:hypothetical protein